MATPNGLFKLMLSEAQWFFLVISSGRFFWNNAVPSLHGHLTTGGPVGFARDIAGLIASHEDKNGSELGRLSGSSEHRLGAELFHLLFGHRGGNKGSPDRTGDRIGSIQC